MAQEVVTPEVIKTEAAPKNRWLTVGVLSLLQLTENSEGGLINSVFPIIRADLGLDLGNLGVLTSIGKFARMIFGPIWAILADRFGRKLILVVTALWGIWTAAAGLAHDFNGLLILYSLGVLGTVAGEPISNGLVSDLFKPTERGRVYGTMRSITGLGSILITPLLGQLANIPDNQGWRIGMFIMGGIGVVAGILSWIFVTDPKHEVTEEKFKEATAVGAAKAKKGGSEGFKLADVPKLLAIPTIALLAVQLLFITSLVLFAFQVVFFTDVRKYSVQEATLLTSVFFAGFTISSFAGGLIGDWFSKKNPRTGRVTLMQIYLVAFAVMSFVAMQMSYPKGALDYIFWFVFGLVASIGFSGCVLPMVSGVILPQYRSTAFALLFSFIQGAISAILSLFLGSLAKQFGLQLVMLYMVTIPYAINAVFWFVFYKTYPKDQERMRQQMLAQATAAPEK
jgi:MFS family permease